MGVILSGVGRAEAGPAWLSASSLTPVEQRIAVSVGPQRSTLWTSLRYEASGGILGIVVPAPVGASLDWSSDAWFEALEVATAPRVFPPANESPFCPGKGGPSSIFETVGMIGHTASLQAQSVIVLDDAASVGTWASTAGLTVPTALQASLQALTGVRFVAILFVAPPGSGVTPTLRIVMPGTPPALPLALTHAAGDDLLVTAFVLGEGRGGLIGGNEVTIPSSAIAWQADQGVSNYRTERLSTLGGDASRYVVECASHDALPTDVSIASGTASIDGVTTTYFERAAAYGDGSFDAPPCIQKADGALASSATVAASCPRAALGVVGSTPSCMETTPAGEVDPNNFRCGAGADDLAVALSGLVPASTWVTRQTLDIAAGSNGLDFIVGIGPGAAQSPVVFASTVDTGSCGGSSSSSSSSGSSGHGSTSSSSSGSSGHHPSYTYGGSDGPSVQINVDLGDDSDVIDNSTLDQSCNCSGTESYSDPSAPDSTSSSCSGSTDTSGSSSGCSGSSDTSTSGGCSSSSSGDSSGCSSGSSGGSDCSGGGGGGGDCGGGGGSFDCSFLGPRRLRIPKFSIMLLSGLAVVTPLRRRGRKSRRQAKP